MKVTKKDIDGVANATWFKEITTRIKETTPPWWKKTRKYAFIVAVLAAIAPSNLPVVGVEVTEGIETLLYGITTALGSIWGVSFTASSKR